MLSRGVATVTFARALEPWYEECVASHGRTGRFATVRMLHTPIREVTSVSEDQEALFVELADRRVRESDPDVIIRAVAPLARPIEHAE